MPLIATRKRYPLHQSPLYRLRGKRRFEEVIGVEWDKVPELLAGDSYRVWLNPKQREIQAPIHWMAAVHKTISDLLARIEFPDYVFSQKGRSYADNARQHIGATPVIKTDIHKFYPSVTHAMVFRMFVQDFECAIDVAERLADICCYKQAHVPTGSPLSGRVAFFATRGLFDDISKLAAASGCKLTIYVDDIVLSGPNATRRLLGEVRTLISRYGLKTKTKKSKSFASGATKPITGAIIVGDELRLPNERHQKLHKTRVAVEQAEGNAKVKLKRELRGRKQEAVQVLQAVSKAAATVRGE